MSVITNTIGHSSVPAVKFSEPVWPNRFHSKRPHAQRVLEREDLDADELGQQRIADEEHRQHQEQPAGPFLSGHARRARAVERDRLGADGAAGDDEGHGLVHGPVGGREHFHRHDFQVARGRVGRGGHVHGGQFAAGAFLAHHAGDEADALHLAVREIDQHHALGAVGLGLQQVQQLARAAVNGLEQRNARDQAFQPRQQPLPDHAPGQPAHGHDDGDGGHHGDGRLGPGVVEPAQHLRMRQRQLRRQRRRPRAG